MTVSLSLRAVVVRILQQPHVAAGHQIHAAVGPDAQVHRLLVALGKRRPRVEPAVAVAVGKHPNAVALGTLVVVRPLVRVRFDDQQPALGVERHPNRRDDVRLLRDKLQPEARLIDKQPRLGGTSNRRQQHNNR